MQDFNPQGHISLYTKPAVQIEVEMVTLLYSEQEMAVEDKPSPYLNE